MIAGDSAGGGLTAALLLKLKELGVHVHRLSILTGQSGSIISHFVTSYCFRTLGMELPGAALMISPWVDQTNSSSTHKSKAEADPMCEHALVEAMSDYYCNGLDACLPEAAANRSATTESGEAASWQEKRLLPLGSTCRSPVPKQSTYDMPMATNL